MTRLYTRPPKPVTGRHKLVNDLDKQFAKYIKMRDCFQCQKSGLPAKGIDAHCAHIIPKSAGQRFRWMPENAILLSLFYHKYWWHKNPTRAQEWFKDKYPDRWKIVDGEPKNPIKYTNQQLQEKLDWLIIKINDSQPEEEWLQF